MSKSEIDTDYEKNISTLNKRGVMAGVIIFIGVALYGIIIIALSWPVTSFQNIDKAGVFGDSFGVLTSLFSGLAFAGIIYTILLQREELRLQRNELELTRCELKAQVEAIKHQNFENTFFQMLRLHNEIVGGMNLKGTGSYVSATQDVRGRESFIYLYREFKEWGASYDSSDVFGSTKILKDNAESGAVIESYEGFYEEWNSYLGHYFRYLYTIFKFVNNSRVEDKKLYTNIIRAQLSDHELVMIFYNCLSKHGVEKFKKLAEQYALFNNLPEKLLLVPGHRDLYDTAAFS